jgi:hypothetical protein
MNTTKKCIDETGHRYGRLTVIRRYHVNGERSAFWLCRCDCGTEVAVRGQYLRCGHTKSCGCQRDEQNRARAAVRKKGAVK